jgi:hypothetical protein
MKKIYAIQQVPEIVIGTFSLMCKTVPELQM